MRTWPPRRWAATAATTPLVIALLLWSNGPVNTSLPFLLVTAAAAVLGGLILASYTPVIGRGLDLGCTPCAVMSGMTVLGGAVSMHTYGASILGPFGAFAIMAFGLTQRLGQSATCATRPGPSHGEEPAIRPTADRE